MKSRQWENIEIKNKISKQIKNEKKSLLQTKLKKENERIITYCYLGNGGEKWSNMEKKSKNDENDGELFKCVSFYIKCISFSFNILAYTNSVMVVIFGIFIRINSIFYWFWFLATS